MKTAVVLVNTGSPAAPTEKAVRSYLAEFLSDRCVVDLPTLIWQPVLKGIILRSRPASSAEKYQVVWRSDGSPLVQDTSLLAGQLQKALQEGHGGNTQVTTAMRYGEPAIRTVLDHLRRQEIQKVFILPLFPQYSSTTTASVIQEVNRHTNGLQIEVIPHYFDTAAYRQALAEQVQLHWQRYGRAEKLLLSFHGIPQKRINLGDPYLEQCRQTAENLAHDLNLSTDDWTMSFQSRFGRGRWLTPSTRSVLHLWAKQGIQTIQVFAPGFPIDCLETLHELKIELAQEYRLAGGQKLEYIPALNADYSHAEMLVRVLQEKAPGIFT